MTKQEIIRDIKKEIGSFPNVSQIARYFGVSRDKVRSEIVCGLEYYEAGRNKRYFVNDIADRVMSHRAT